MVERPLHTRKVQGPIPCVRTDCLYRIMEKFWEESKSKKRKMGISGKAFVFDKAGKFLTIRRTKTAPFNPLRWDLPGGYFEYGEDPKKAILREIKEEVGFKVKKLIPIDVAAHLYRDGVYWITIAYACQISSGKVKIGWEHDLHKWVTIKEFMKLNASKRLKCFTKALVGIKDLS